VFILIVVYFLEFKTKSSWVRTENEDLDEQKKLRFILCEMVDNLIFLGLSIFSIVMMGVGSYIIKNFP
jgi:hypothetical protein